MAFVPADGEASFLLISSSVSLLSRDTMQPENICIMYAPGDRSGLRKPKKLITTTISLRKSVSTDITIKSESVLTNPVGRDGVQG